MERYVGEHACGGSCHESSKLRVNVGEECAGRPASMFLDGQFAEAIELHSHCSAGAERVAADVVGIEATILKAQCLNCPFYCFVDV